MEDAIRKRLLRAGISPATIDAVLEIDAVMQNWRRRISKREFALSALRDLSIDLDLAALDVLTAIEAPSNEFGTCANADTMVATVAERLGIDPSRASRVVSEMVEAGYVRRAASQIDARRTVLHLTERGKAVVAAVRSYKFLMMADFLDRWNEAELAGFVPLLASFSAWSEQATAPRCQRSAELQALVAEIAVQRQEIAKEVTE